MYSQATSYEKKNVIFLIYAYLFTYAAIDNLLPSIKYVSSEGSDKPSEQTLQGLLSSHLNNTDVDEGLEQQIPSSGNIHLVVKITCTHVSSHRALDYGNHGD